MDTNSERTRRTTGKMAREVTGRSSIERAASIKIQMHYHVIHLTSLNLLAMTIGTLVRLHLSFHQLTLIQTPEELCKLQQVGDKIGPILATSFRRQQATFNSGKNRSYRLLLQQWNQLYMQNSLLFQRYEDISGHKKLNGLKL